MNPFLAASLFDNPWLVVLILIVGSLVNWLAKRAQDRQAAESAKARGPSRGQPSPPTVNGPSPELNLEDAVRQLLGMDPMPPAPQPPVIPDAARSGPPLVPEGRDAESQASAATSLSAQPDSNAPWPAATTATPGQAEEWREVLHRWEVRRQGEPPTTAHRPAPLAVRRAKVAGLRRRFPWRSPRHAREAWVASIVFGPPPSLQP